MPRRIATRNSTADSATPHAPSPGLAPQTFLPSDVLELRRQWKWAAFSQFFFTFAPLFNMDDVSIADIENDLTSSTNIFLPRVMQRLLYTVSQDRKVNLENWQTAFRKQYLKRDPLASPLGPEPVSTPPPESSPAPEDTEVAAEDETLGADGGTPMISTTHPTPAPEEAKGEGDAMESKAEGVNEEATEDHSDAAASIKETTEEPVQPIKEESPPKEESKDWLDLPMLVKLDSMHLLTEWQFQNPIRLRTIMKSDDETATWRVEPIGYDSKSNAYWLIGADRLWIQRAPPKPPQSRKRKRPTATEIGGRKAKRTVKEPAGKADAAISTSGRSGRRNGVQTSTPAASGRGSGRAAKTQARAKMDAQAKELAEFQRLGALAAKNKGKAPTTPPVPKGTRISKRLRGAVGEEEWQPMPDEWLEGSGSPSPTKARKPSPKTGLESDDESALTSLSDEEEEREPPVTAEDDGDQELSHNNDEDGTVNGATDDMKSVPEFPSDFIEWETIAVTLYEWEHAAEPFEKATHYTEKALFKILTLDIIPVITAELREIERKKHLEEALVHRKRSSRIAIKESEKEEAELAAKKKQEEDEKMSRARRLEARQLKEAAEREKKESAREQRRRERELREQQPRSERHRQASADMQIDVVGDDLQRRSRTNGLPSRRSGPMNGSMSGSGSGARTPMGDDWELDCEICHRRGINQKQDDGQPMMSCGICSKWQHISCHDAADQRTGRPKRNWDIEEFVCQRCRSQATRRYDDPPLQPSKHYSDHSAARLHTQLPPSTNHIAYIPTTSATVPRTAPMYAGTQSYGMSIPNEHRVQDNFRTTTHVPQQQSYQPPPTSAITFAHYQPDPQGFSTRQTYHRDIPSQGQAYQQHQYASPSSQPRLSAATTTLQPLQPASHPPQAAPYGNGGWNPGQQFNQSQYNHNPGFPAVQPILPEQQQSSTQWQAPRQNLDPRIHPQNHYPHYQHNPVMGSSQLPH